MCLPVLFEFSERAKVEADREWLACGERVSGTYLSFQGVLIAVQGEDGDLGLGFEVHDPVEGYPGPGVLAALSGDRRHDQSH
jgi:hypothetical protein